MTGRLMGDGLKRAWLAAARTRLTPRQQTVLDALTDEMSTPDQIARRARITTVSPRETASNFCRQLVKLGLAEKGGSAMFPVWRRAKP